MGWRDLRRACDGEHAGARPVEATRQYNYRWNEFNRRFLQKDSPVGYIERSWYRHEEQGRGSLHVHMALWIKGGIDKATPDAIVGMAPRLEACGTPAEREWRDFVLHVSATAHAIPPSHRLHVPKKVISMQVQTHECVEACHWKKGEKISDTFCKSGYPRVEFNADKSKRNEDGSVQNVSLDLETDRYIYRTGHKDTNPEDLKLSPYIPLWLLAWGANMNIQFCTTAGFLAYISKYVTKPEPSATLPDSAALRYRENASAQVRSS